MTRPATPPGTSATTPARLLELARIKWKILDGGADRLVTPNSRAFFCQPDLCDSLCCRNPYIASVSIWDVEALERAGQDTAHFLVSGSSPPPYPADPLDHRQTHKEEKQRSTLWWLAQPADEGCTFLRGDGGCSVYRDRPNGCAQYPHTVAFVPIHGRHIVAPPNDVDALDRALRIAAGTAQGLATYVPLLLRDTACPGFTGPPLGRAGYRRLLLDIWAMSACFDHNQPCGRHPHPAT